MTRRSRAAPGTTRALLLMVCFGFCLSSCAYYNTYYLARKYYDKGTAGLPYVVEKADASHADEFNKSIEYSKKLIAEYPKDKLVDDAYLLWARALLGNDDPRQAIKLLADFPTRFPKSSLVADAGFYLGVAYRQARKYKDALGALDEFLAKAPRHRLAPYALLERARTLRSLDRPEEAAAAAGEALERFPKSGLLEQARVARAEARFAQGAYDKARDDYRELGLRSRTDQDRLDYLLKEADCLDGARQYEEELRLLNEALSHERAPGVPDTTRSGPTAMMTPMTLSTGSEPWARLTIRIGTAQLHAGRLEDALAAYRSVVLSYPRTEFAAEAQYRIGYAYETAADDFEKARIEYARVKDQSMSSSFATESTRRLTNLDRLAQFRSSTGDSVEKKAEAGFLLAELYLFQLEKPDRALEEYRKVATDFEGTPLAAKAMNAQAWVLSRKLKRSGDADSLFWAVVRKFPATEAQLAARDYLELEGISVPSELIKMPERLLARADTLPGITPPPTAPTPLGTAPAPVAAGFDSTPPLGPRIPPALLPPPGMFSTARGAPPRPGDSGAPSTPGDNPARGGGDVARGAPAQAPPRAAARPDSAAGLSPAASDSSRAPGPAQGSPSPAPPDSSRSPR